VELELDLERIAKLAEERDDQNVQFRTFLKGIDMGSAALDATVHQLYDEVSSQIDCTKCANCCKLIRPVLDQADVSEFAAGLRQSASEVEGEYLRLHEDSVSKYEFKGLPCPFLKDNQCSNYECRPKDCRSYPHLHKDGFSSRLWGVVDNYSICPIVFNVYERLKAELWHDDGRDDFGFEWR
jgi:Fe-S-cluster containining protein